jgi:signal transduction histidine kinase/ligand-binding sensor domain-containing protein
MQRSELPRSSRREEALIPRKIPTEVRTSSRWRRLFQKTAWPGERLLPLAAALALPWAGVANAGIVWSDLGATLVHDTGAGSSFLTGSAMDILGGAVRQDDASTNTLYFKFHVDPLSDVNTEEYFAAFQLYEGETERLAVGNSLKAWAYSAFKTEQTGEANKVFGDVDLHSSTPETAAPNSTNEFPHRGVEKTIVFKVQYVAGGKDLVTVWLNPDLAPGATEAGQPESLVTRFTADAAFNQIRLRHGGGGGGWTFSDMAIATSFSDFVASSTIESGESTYASARGPLPFTIRTWQRKQGLPQDSVRALGQTRDGYLWVGTDDGVSRFDGLRFVSFGTREGLGNLPVSALLGDSRGSLWIGGADGGLSRWQDGRFTTWTTQDGLPDNSITSLAEDSEGRIWIGTVAGLGLWQDGRIVPFDAAAQFKGRAITTLFRDRQGTMWLGAVGAGIFRFRSGQFSALTDASMDGLLLDPHCLLVDQSGRIWIGAGDDFVLCHDGGDWHRYRIPRHLARPFVGALAEEPDGTVWAGSVSEGLFQFRGGKLAAFNASSGLSGNLVASLLVDREGKLWVGTDSGLNRLRRQDLFAFGQNEGLGYGPVQGMAQMAPDVVLVAKPNDGLYRWDGRRFSRLNGAGLAGADFHSILRDHDGGCWVAGTHGLLHFADANALTNGPDAAALNGRDVVSLAEDRQRDLWAGTHEGQLWRRQGTNWIAQTNLWQNHAITVIVPDPGGAVWIGSDGGGLDRFDGKSRMHLDKSRGLLSEQIRSLFLDAHGTLWIGTAGGGLSRLDQGKIHTVTTREGLPGNTISQIVEDSSSRLWLGTDHGIACVSKRDLDELAAGKVPAVYPRIFGTAEGMLSEECTGGFSPAGLRTQSGLLWFSTQKGVVVADARPRSLDVIPPKVVLEEILLDGVPHPEFQTAGSQNSILHVAPGQHRIDLQYTGLGFDAPERMRFRYQLEGLDPDWVEAGTVRRAPYNYVPPGNYRFRVTACNSDGVWGEVVASVDLVVLRHFWQAWWVIALAILGLLVLLVGTIRLVERRRLHRRLVHLEQERKLQRERERIARDLHDDLGSSLARISLLSSLARADKDHPAQVELHMDKISSSAAHTVRALEEIVWAVRPDSDSLQSLVEYIAHFGSELFDGDSASCRLDLPHDLPAFPLPPDMRHNIFLIVKEALTNAFKHAAATEVRVHTKADGRTIEFVVADNGRGFAPATDPASGKRNGLTNMRQRAAAIGARLEVQSASGTGTSVRLVVQIPNDRATG